MLYVVCSNNRLRCLKVTEQVWMRIKLLHGLGVTKLSGFSPSYTESVSKNKHSIRSDGQQGTIKFRVCYVGHGKWLLNTWECNNG